MHQLLPLCCNHLVGLGFGILGIKLVSFYVPPEVYGRYALFLTLTQLGILLVHSGLNNHVSRYWQREKGRMTTYAHFVWHRSWLLSMPLAILLLAICLILAGIDRRGDWLWIFPLLWISNIGFSLWGLANVALNAQERNWLFFFLGALGSGTRAVLPVGMVLVASASMVALGAGFALHTGCVVAAVFYLYTRLGPKPELRSEARQAWLKELKEFGRPFVLIGLGNWFLQSADRWVVAFFYGDEQAGLFSLAANLAVVIPAMAGGILLQWIFPKIFRKADAARSGDDWRLLARHCDWAALAFLAAVLPGLGLLWMIGPHLVPWLIDQKYLAAMSMLLPAGMTLAVMPLNQFHYLLLQGQHNSVDMVKVMLVVAGLKTAGSLLAAAVSWECFMAWLAFSLLLCGWLGRRLIRKNVLAVGRLSNPEAMA